MSQLLYKARFWPENTIYIHLFCWIIFIVYEISVSAVLAKSYHPFSFYFFYYLLNICLFYFHSLIILNKASPKLIINLWWIPLAVTIELAVYCSVYALLNMLLMALSGKKMGMEFLTQPYVISVAYRGIYFILYGTGYFLLMRYNQRKELELNQSIEYEKLKNELLLAEQDFLRAQINPHLLFNTLSFIKYAAKRNADEANEAIMRLSGIMSYALEHNSTTVPLRKELDQVENIIRLNQLRYNHSLQINYTKNIYDDETPVIPIVLLTLVENVFKHGDLLNKRYPAEISIETTAEYMLFRTSNLPNGSRDERNTQTGLNNIRSRLRHLYKDGFQFNSGSEEEMFKVEIKIYCKPNEKP